MRTFDAHWHRLERDSMKIVVYGSSRRVGALVGDHPAPADGGPLRRWRRHRAAVSRWPQAPWAGHTGEMDRERAENHLRLVAEAELRRATAHPRDGAPTPPDLPGAGALVLRQRSAVAEALYDLPSHQREAIALQYYADLSELETARRYQIPVVVIINNNSGMNQESVLWKRGTLEDRNWAFQPVDFAAVARSFGCLGWVVHRGGELAQALRSAIAARKPAVIDCRTDPSVLAPTIYTDAHESA